MKNSYRDLEPLLEIDEKKKLLKRIKDKFLSLMFINDSSELSFLGLLLIYILYVGIVSVLFCYLGTNFSKEEQKKYKKCLIVCSGYEVLQFHVDEESNKLICKCDYTKGIKVIDK